MENIIYFINVEHSGFEFFFQTLSSIFLFHKNLIVVLMALELYFLNISLEILDISDKLEDVHGHIFVLFILSISACESAIGLALFLSLYSEKKASSLNDIKYLKG